MQPNREIILDRTDAATDRDWAADEHEILFGHRPHPGPDGRCTHALHVEMRRIIEGPGVEAAVQFDPNLVISDDAAEQVAAERGYAARVAHYRDEIALIEQRQAFLDALDPHRAQRRMLRRAKRREMEREIAKIERKLGVN